MVRREMMKLCLCVLPIFLAGSVVMADVAVNIDAVTSDGAWPVNLPFGLGYTFTVDTEIIVTELGRFDIDGAGLKADALSRLYNWDTGQAIAEVTITPSSPAETTGIFNSYFEAIHPVVLVPGTTYLLATEVGAGDFYFDQTRTIATFSASINHLVGKATPVGSPSMPEIADESTFTISNDKDTY